MKYNCGHKGCDVCGARECANVELQHFGIYEVCDSCVALAVKVAVNMAETFGGTIIDPAKPCGNRKASVPAQGQPEESSNKTIDSQPAQA